MSTQSRFLRYLNWEQYCRRSAEAGSARLSLQIPRWHDAKALGYNRIPRICTGKHGTEAASSIEPKINLRRVFAMGMGSFENCGKTATTVLSRREWLRKAGMGAAALSVAPGMLSTSLWAKEPVVLDHSRGNISDDQEIELGKKFGDQLEKEVEIVRNPVIDEYLGNMVRDLAAKSQRPNMPYYIKLVNTAEVNASSIPGGGIYLNRGLLELLTSEDELAATLGHEIGHVVGRHVINRLVLSFQAKQVLKPVLDNLNKNNGVVQNIILKFGGALAMLTMLHFSREDEAQADLLGFYECLRAGWDPHGFVKEFELIDKLEKASGGIQIPFMSDHPPTPQRVAAMKRECTLVKIPDDAKTDSPLFHACKTAVKLLPPPPKPKKPEAPQQ